MNRFISIDDAALRDAADPLAPLRAEFHLPTLDGEEVIYLTGNSLGLQPRGTEAALRTELESWQKYGVEAHFHGPNPWMPYHERLTDSLARLAGAKPTEVVAMGSLTGNLHTLLASFYRPTAERPLLMCEAKAFPSDQYALTSQTQWHPHGELFEIRGTDPEGAPNPDEVLATIEAHGQRGATLLMGGVHYFTGRSYPIAEITAAAQAKGMLVGWDLAHAMGNVPLKLHEWGVDFAAWCSYKYLNSSPGGVAGLYVHERHHGPEVFRLAGWWGHDKATRFKMPPEFVPEASAEAWQWSNAPVLGMAAQRAALDLFDRADLTAYRAKSLAMTDVLLGMLDHV
ncbi:MAG: kynureninase [Schleiferiaceae bacterium]